MLLIGMHYRPMVTDKPAYLPCTLTKIYSVEAPPNLSVDWKSTTWALNSGDSIWILFWPENKIKPVAKFHKPAFQ